MSSIEVTDVVLLIPGFLAFDRLGKHSYFADTVTKALEAGLETTAEPPLSFEVVSITVPSVDTLASRQRALLVAMNDASARHPHARVHLVGHSTGGLDAELLLRSRPVGRADWSTADSKVRAKLQSITTIASPLRGTTLATAALAELLSARWRDVGSTARSLLLGRQLDDVVRQTRDLLGAALALPGDPAFRNVLRGTLQEKHLLGKFLLSVIRRHGLIGDLRPDHVETLMHNAEDPVLSRVRRARFLTIAPATAKPSTAALLFDALYNATKQQAEGSTSPAWTRELVARFESGKIVRIGARADLDTLIATLGPTDNDGIVNTLRQLFVASTSGASVELDRVVAIVLADHLDVVGYYPNNQVATKSLATWLRPSPERNGFLESGAHFRDPELKQLYTLVAEQIRKAIPATYKAAEANKRAAPRAEPHVQIVQA